MFNFRSKDPIGQREHDLLKAAQNLVDAVNAMPSGYKSGELMLAVRDVENAIENVMIPAISARSPRLIRALTNYPQFLTEEATTAADELERAMAS